MPVCSTRSSTTADLMALECITNSTPSASPGKSMRLMQQASGPFLIPTGLGRGVRIQRRKAVSKSSFLVFMARNPEWTNQTFPRQCSRRSETRSAPSPIKAEPVWADSLTTDAATSTPARVSVFGRADRSGQPRDPEIHRPLPGQTLLRGIRDRRDTFFARGHSHRKSVPMDATCSARGPWVQRQSVQRPHP